MKILAKYSIASAKLLRDCLEEKTGKRILVTKDSSKIRNTEYIRYGNSNPCLYQTNLNNPDFISLCASKIHFAQKCFEFGIKAVQFQMGNPDRFPVVIRKTLSGSKGKGIVFCNNEEEFEENNGERYYWSYYINGFELRVHIVGNNHRIFKKIPNDGFENNPIRNNANCHFSLRNDENYKKLIPLIEQIREFFPNQFVALDVIWDYSLKEYTIIEANSAPGLNKNTANLLADYILNWF